MKLSEIKEMVMKAMNEETETVVDETYIQHKDEVDKMQAERDKLIANKQYKEAKVLGDKIMSLIKQA